MAAGKGNTSGSKATGPDEETKRKFREALERKNAKGRPEGGEHGDTSKVHGTHGPEATSAQQMFRRKSG